MQQGCEIPHPTSINQLHMLFFYFNSFNAFSNSGFVIGGPSFSGVISSSLSNSSSSSELLYNSSTYCCHLSAVSSSAINVFPSFDVILVLFILSFPKSFLIRLYEFPQLSWFSVSSWCYPSHSSLSFLAFLFIRSLSQSYSLLFLSCLCFLLCSIRVMVFFSLIHGFLGCYFKFSNVSFAVVVIACCKFSHC